MCSWMPAQTPQGARGFCNRQNGAEEDEGEMARIRTIKPEFWADEGVASLSRDARLLFIATWNLADDEGLLRWSADYLKAQVFPYDAEMKTTTIKRLLAELEDGGFVYPYKGGRLNQPLGFVVQFLAHQRINRPQPSRLPAPSLQNARFRVQIGRRDGMVCHLCREMIAEVTDSYANPFGPHESKWYEQNAQKLSIDHVVPRSKGGSDYPSNLRASHISCNKSRGARDLPFTEPFSESFTEPVTESGSELLTHSSMNGSPPEWNGRERKGMDVAPMARRAESKPRKARAPDPLWDALMLACAVVVSEMTSSARGGYNQALKELKDAGATCDMVRDRARMHRGKWPGVPCTPNSLAKHWAELGPAPKAKSEPRQTWREYEVPSEPF